VDDISGGVPPGGGAVFLLPHRQWLVSVTRRSGVLAADV
jgi:hypothetical protein